MIRIGIMAPGRRLTEATALRVQALARQSGLDVELIIHPRCHLEFGHFAGDDNARLGAFLDMANDPDIDAIWFARGGYGSARLLAGLTGKLGPHAQKKVYLGYSDIGFLFAELLSEGCRFCAHGPLVGDLDRDGGEAAALRALGFLARGPASGLAKGIDPAQPNLAFNLSVLRSLLGTGFEPPQQAGTTLWLEDVAEYTYATDRSMFQLVHSSWFKTNVAQVHIGRFSFIPENEVQFHMGSSEAVAWWCEANGVKTTKGADIGHDIDNKIIPFGLLSDWYSAGLIGKP
jgi:muramoyltetrapeptide carboxypeptidase